MGAIDVVDGRLDVTRADAIILLIPSILLGIVGVGYVTLDAWFVPAVLASIACALLIADGLFWHQPSRG